MRRREDFMFVGGVGQELRREIRAAPTLEHAVRYGQITGPRQSLTMRSVSQDVPIGSSEISLAQLNERSREIFRQIVDSYLATGEPVGSRNLSRIIPMTLSPASVRNVMQDLERLGLIYAPHASAGRLPTELGLRFFVDALMQIGDLSDNDRLAIEGQVAAAGTTVENGLTEASGLPAGLPRAARVVTPATATLQTRHPDVLRPQP